MTQPVPSVAAVGFGRAAAAYERGRPGYPETAVAWLAGRLRIGPGRDVLDLAAGTGKLTAALAPLGARLVAVEPVDGMRERLAAALPGVDVRAGTAEAIPLGDASLDAVLVGQAFHWFRPEEALAEIRRVLRPGGALALVWNVRDLRDPLQARLHELTAPLRGDAPSQASGDWAAVVEASGRFAAGELRSWAWVHVQAPEEVVDRIDSVSFVAAAPPGTRAALLAEVGRLACAHAAGGRVRMPYTTDAYVFAAA